MKSNRIRRINTILFPLRALLLPSKGMRGLLSLREERMAVVARYCRGIVLDVGCGPGNLFINNYIGPASGIGIDVFPYEGVEFVHKDMTKLPFADSSFDTVTLVAVGGHIPRPKRVAEFHEFGRVLKPGGRLLMTEGEPLTQFLIHKLQEIQSRFTGKKSMDLLRGMDEEEEYCMPLQEIRRYLNTPPFVLMDRIRFMWNMNNLYIAQKGL